MEKGYSLYSQGSSGWTSMKNEEFQEGDVWEVLKQIKDSDFSVSSSEQPSLIAKRLPTAAKLIPKSVAKISRQSAPLTIPDWSKICGTSSKNSSSSWLDPDSNDDGSRHHHGFGARSWESEDECQVDGDGCVIPPHEWIARRMARSQISSFSVFEGAGRTLKGRDLSRVRNAVLSKTGFLEPKSDYN